MTWNREDEEALVEKYAANICILEPTVSRSAALHIARGMAIAALHARISLRTIEALAGTRAERNANATVLRGKIPSEPIGPWREAGDGYARCYGDNEFLPAATANVEAHIGRWIVYQECNATFAFGSVYETRGGGPSLAQRARDAADKAIESMSRCHPATPLATADPDAEAREKRATEDHDLVRRAVAYVVKREVSVHIVPKMEDLIDAYTKVILDPVPTPEIPWTYAPAYRVDTESCGDGRAVTYWRAEAAREKPGRAFNDILMGVGATPAEAEASVRANVASYVERVAR